jgi:N-methylhydantoinase A
VYWKEEKGFQKTPVYDYGRLQCGNVIEGPAVVEAHDTTIVIPHGVRFSIDVHMNNIMELRF